jgi:7-carboxy-7-deazaguanine synthase
MSYAVKELFYTLQGEGANAGRPAVFCRFAGCNLWSGREVDRDSAVCSFCDTDFVGVDGPGGGRFTTSDALAKAIHALWPQEGRPFVVFTGGEPLLQLDTALVDAVRESGFEVAVETNGTIPSSLNIDWVCVSPKAESEVVVRKGQELKLVFPQSGAEPARFESWEFDHFFLQPLAGPQLERNTQLAIKYCLEHPHWRLSLQTHKFLGIP